MTSALRNLVKALAVPCSGAQFPVGFWQTAAGGGGATLSSATVASDGTTVTLAFSGNVTHTTGTEPTIAMTAGAAGTSPGAATLVYASGTGTASLVYTFIRTAKAHNLTAVETSAVSFTSGALNCAAFSGTGTTNNSTVQTYTVRDSATDISNGEGFGLGQYDKYNGLLFTSASAYKLTAFEIYGSNPGGADSASMTPHVWANATGLPGTDQGAGTARILSASAPADWQRWLFGTAIGISTTTPYWLGEYFDSVSSTNYLSAYDGDYTGVNGFAYSDDGSSWTGAEGRQGAFKTYSSP